MESRRYGYTKAGRLIVAPKGWRILPEGEDIPQHHREFIDYMGLTQWCWERRCHSTMTALWACVWGAVYAYAVPIETAVGSSSS